MRMKRLIVVSFVLVCCMMIIGCSKTNKPSAPENEIVIPTDTPVMTPEPTMQPVEEEDHSYEEYDRLYEAEKAERLGLNLVIEDSLLGYTGTGYVTGFEGEDDKCIITVEVPKDGFYDLEFVGASSVGEAEGQILLDDKKIETLIVSTEEFSDNAIREVFIEEGTHQIMVSSSTGGIYLDALHIVASIQAEGENIVTPTLNNPNVNDTTSRLMRYFCDNYGKSTITGQFASEGIGSEEFEQIKKLTGKTPAILGLYTDSDFVEKAIEWNQKGGIILVSWSLEDSKINLEKSLNGKDKKGYQTLLDEIKKIASELKKLEEQDISILFSPIEQTAEKAYWWEQEDAKYYKQLWKLIYDQLTNEYEVNNVIWVWRGQDQEWYPGSHYVDMNASQWSWFCMTTVELQDHLKDTEAFKELYNQSKIITLLEIPCIKQY